MGRIWRTFLHRSKDPFMDSENVFWTKGMRRSGTLAIILRHHAQYAGNTWKSLRLVLSKNSFVLSRKEFRTIAAFAG